LTRLARKAAGRLTAVRIRESRDRISRRAARPGVTLRPAASPPRRRRGSRCEARR
jgi:hypothetical protein